MRRGTVADYDIKIQFRNWHVLLWGQIYIVAPPVYLSRRRTISTLVDNHNRGGMGFNWDINSDFYGGILLYDTLLTTPSE